MTINCSKLGPALSGDRVLCRGVYLLLFLWVASNAFIGCEDTAMTSSEGAGETLMKLDATSDIAVDHAGSRDMSLPRTDAMVEVDGGLLEPDAMMELDPEGVSPGDTSALQLQEIKALNFGAFTTSSACALCHSNHFAATAMRNSEGEAIGPYNLWRGSMMANASRDPFWWAQVASEVALSPPEKREYIEGECIRCHAPALSRTARSEAGREGQMRDLKGGSHPAMVGVDGVACTTCHQILPDNLGTPSSFSGHFEINDERLIFGPHRNPAPGPMLNHVDYRPTYADHVTESKLCATCHTLIHPEDEDVEMGEGRDNWGFPEQTPYLEWRNSIFNNEDDPDNPDAQTCQSCHQPTYDDQGRLRTRIARSPPGGDFRIDPREPFGQHTFVGGNTVLPQIMKRERETLQPSGTDEALDMISELAIRQLESSADVEVSVVERDANRLSLMVTVRPKTGHKLPTGFPSRRVWIKLSVIDAQGRRVFVSGRYNGQGRILGSNDQPLPSEWVHGPVEPHHEIINSADQVQIYQAVMGDDDGQYTHAITQARGWIKDNRLLPLGYRETHPEAQYTRPVGVQDDLNFTGGEDRVTYDVELAEATGTLEVKVSLIYQTLGARFMRMLFQVDRPEVAAFRAMYERADVSPVTIAEQTIEVP